MKGKLAAESGEDCYQTGNEDWLDREQIGHSEPAGCGGEVGEILEASKALSRHVVELFVEFTSQIGLYFIIAGIQTRDRDDAEREQAVDCRAWSRRK